MVLRFVLRLTVGVAVLTLWCGPAMAAEPAWESLLPAVDLTRHVVAGDWTGSDGTVTTTAANGSRLWLPFAPRGEYDIRVSFTRQTGQHSIALVVPHGTGQVSFEVDAWGQHLAGFQNVSGQSIQRNTTRIPNVALRNGQRYGMTVEVRKNRIRGLLDDRVIATLETDGSNLAVPDLWRLPNASTPGVGAWASQVVFHTVEARMLNGKPVPRFDETRPPAVATTTPAAATPPRTASRPSTRPAAARPAKPKRVLIVIANQDFFYREFADPREELEKAGIDVVVAAGRNAPCRPHANSGQGGGAGIVEPDVALADVRADDFDAILFSGGWGASAYQYAFNGGYDNPAYNGDRGVKDQVNNLINEFLKQNKYTCALCNGVSVLAWARVDGRSPLEGKTVCAPTRQAPPGIYDGQRARPSCRWHPEANGAVMSPAGSIGRPGTAEDDVAVDGLIVTGEDDISARAMGRTIVELLSTP